jgi:hypothetical protein
MNRHIPVKKKGVMQVLADEFSIKYRSVGLIQTASVRSNLLGDREAN